MEKKQPQKSVQERLKAVEEKRLREKGSQKEPIVPTPRKTAENPRINPQSEDGWKMSDEETGDKVVEAEVILRRNKEEEARDAAREKKLKEMLAGEGIDKKEEESMFLLGEPEEEQIEDRPIPLWKNTEQEHKREGRLKRIEEIDKTLNELDKRDKKNMSIIKEAQDELARVQSELEKLR